MKFLFSNFFPKTVKYLRYFIYSKKLGVFLVFLILSTIFWLLNQLEDVYLTTVSYPVKYTNPPQHKVFVGELPSSLELEIQARGFKILEYKIGKGLMPIELNVNSYSLRSNDEDNRLQYYITTDAARNRIAQQLSSSIEIVDITPDSLFFEFAERTEKRVPVTPKLTYTLGKQLMLKGDIQKEPDSITIAGPSKILDTIESIPTEHQEISEITKTIDFYASLQEVNGRVEYSQGDVHLTIPVEQFTEGTLSKEITIKNKPDSVMVRTFPKSIQITYNVGLSNYQKVIPELFKATVSYDEVQSGAEKLRVQVDKAPEYLKSFTYTPQTVDYIIERKND